MAFMQPCYSNAKFVEITSGRNESRLVEKGCEYLEDGDRITATYKGKWFAHLSADGYLDQTDWSGPFDTEDEARDHIRDFYEVDPDTGDDLKGARNWPNRAPMSGDEA
jgi:hypothetical protein